MITLKTVNDFKRLVGESDFSVTYRKTSGKQAGQFRKAERANCDAVKTLVKGNGNEAAAETREDRGVVVYFDREKNGIRSFALETMRRLEVGGQVYQFGL